MTFRAALEHTLLTIVTTRDLLSLAILSVLLYAFYYPAPYAHQSARALPVVVVNGDGGTAARRLLDDLGETRSVRVVGEVPDMVAARGAVRDRKADGILLISRDFTSGALTGRGTAGIALWLNGTYLLRAQSIGTGVAATLAGAIDRWRAAQGGARLAAMPTILVHPLFNTTLGYRDYIFPAVANIILQQTLLLACARLMAERQRRRERRMSVAAALGMWAACTLVGVLSALLYFGMIYWIQDIPHAGALPALLVAVPVFAATVAALGLLLGKLFNSGDDALKILLPTSVPLVFLAGFAWPLHAMPGWLSALAWFSPATCAMHIFVPLNQMGASLEDVFGPLAKLMALLALYGGLNIWSSTNSAR
ncbi:ABC transporter permease [Sphingomonas hankookensis]|jgi:ABC-2 type transport system permease protein|uniref:ABC transporter permease n=1 Tax=Sphingomonas hankookensis TaxID=563996 RepID=UPI00345CEE6D